MRSIFRSGSEDHEPLFDHWLPGQGDRRYPNDGIFTKIILLEVVLFLPLLEHPTVERQERHVTIKAMSAI